MKIASLTAILVTVAALAAAHANVTVLDNDKTLDVDCAKDPEIHLLGNHLTVTAKGLCTRINIEGNHAKVTGSAAAVRVAGNHNDVTLAAADEVLIQGNSNNVTVRKAIKRKAPRIANTGNENRVASPK